MDGWATSFPVGSKIVVAVRCCYAHVHLHRLDPTPSSPPQVVGVEKLLAFFRYCFLGQTYYVTDAGSPEHALWDHKDATDT